MKYQVAVIGDCVKDIFLQVKSRILRVPQQRMRYLGLPYGEKVTVDDVHYDLGGSACNAAVGMSCLGVKTNFSSIVGNDSFGKDAIVLLKKEKIGTTHVAVEQDSPSYFSIILTGPDGDRTILTTKAKHDFSVLKVDAFLDTAQAICLSGINGYSKDLQGRILRYLKKHDKPLYINPSAFQLKHNRTILKKLIAHADITSLNRTEAEILVGKRHAAPKELMEKIRALGTDVVLVTEGDRGAYAYDGIHFYKITIYPVTRQDSAGSGDAFFATFIAARLRGAAFETALRLASINAGVAASVYGAQKGLLGWAELMKRDKEQKVRIRMI